MDTDRYLGLFLAESRARLSGAERILHRAGGVPAGGADLDELFRNMHSVKGMAATMGLADLAALAHAVEDLLAAVREGALEPAGLPPALPWEALACMGGVVDALAAGRPTVDGRVAPLIRRLRAASGLPDEAPTPSPPAERTSSPEDPPDPPRLDVEVDLRAGVWRSRLALSIIRSLGRVGRVVRFLPPTSQHADGKGLRLSCSVRGERAADELCGEIGRIDGVEAVRVTPATVADAPTVRPERPLCSGYVRVRVDVADALLAAATELLLAHEALRAVPSVANDPDAAREFSRCASLARRLHRAISDVRLLPFETLVPALVLGARDAASSLGKAVRVDIEGRHVGIDRSLLDAIADPLLHLVRNAVAHGIEDPTTRAERGKPGPGTIRIRVVRDRDRIRIELSDDGRGLDVSAIRLAAADRRFGTGERDLSDQQILDLVTRAGLSTAPRGGRIAGRGVGLDVVRHEVERLGGRLHVRSRAGEGSTFVVDLPQAQTVIPSLLFTVGGELFALPIHAVERTLALGHDGADAPDRAASQGAGAAWALEPIAGRLGLDLARDSAAGGRVAIVPRGGERVALVVDEVVGRRDILVRPLEAPLRGVRAFAGAALLDDGRIALVVDPFTLDRPVSRDAC